MNSNEGWTNKDSAQSHFRVTEDLFLQAKELSKDPDGMTPNPMPELRRKGNLAIDLLWQAQANLEHAQDFGYDLAEVKRVRDEIVTLRSTLKKND